MTPEEVIEEQRRLIMGCLIEKTIRIVFKSHYYEWNGEYYHQSSEGPQRLNSTQPFTRILMD